MKLSVLSVIIVILLYGCHPAAKETLANDNRISLRTDTVNVAKITDTLVAYSSTCRGCAFEMSTRFSVEDSLGVVKLYDVITKDKNPAGMNGGNVDKEIVIVPLKTGMTTIRLFRFYKEPETAKDSADYSTYTIDIKK
jgi:hypothetical protein